MPAELQRHVAVLDANVYLDVARIMGAPFSWSAFDELVVKNRTAPIPCRTAPELSAAFLVAMCTSGRFAGDETLEVWTNSHIDRMVRDMAHMPIEGDPSGLGWSAAHAQGLVDDLIGRVTATSGGGTLGVTFPPAGNPPLDHEDGNVYAACRELANDDLLCRVYCVTSDKPFLKAAREGRLPNHATVLQPAAMVTLMRRARASLSIRAMQPPTIG